MVACLQHPEHVHLHTADVHIRIIHTYHSMELHHLPNLDLRLVKHNLSFDLCRRVCPFLKCVAIQERLQV